LTDLWCEELKRYRLSELESQLKHRQPKYLREKAETLKWMKKEQEELNLEVTVSQADIEECLQKAEELEAKLKAEEENAENVEKKDYFIYTPEKVVTGQVYD